MFPMCSTCVHDVPRGALRSHHWAHFDHNQNVPADHIVIAFVEIIQNAQFLIGGHIVVTLWWTFKMFPNFTHQAH
jgi:hypothetical protein